MIRLTPEGYFIGFLLTTKELKGFSLRNTTGILFSGGYNKADDI
jgi:hypothetical protein